MAGLIYQWLANPRMPLSQMFGQLKADIRARLELPSASTSRRPPPAKAKTAVAKTRTVAGNGRAVARAAPLR